MLYGQKVLGRHDPCVMAGRLDCAGQRLDVEPGLRAIAQTNQISPGLLVAGCGQAQARWLLCMYCDDILGQRAAGLLLN